MNESQFTRSLANHVKRIDDTIYYWKIMAMHNNGVPDCYFSGYGGDLWCEVKWIKIPPKRGNTEIKINLSKLQANWLLSRNNEGRNVCVILGSPEGCVVYPNVSWNGEPTYRYDLTMSRKEVAQWIVKQVT